MAKLDQKKIRWIIRERQKIEDGKDGAFTMAYLAKYSGVTARRIRQLWAQYRAAGRVPELDAPGRPRSACWNAHASIVTSAYAKYRCGSVELGRMIKKEWNIHIPHYAVLAIMQERGLSSKVPARSRRRKWIRYERAYSNSMWHSDFKHMPGGEWLLTYQDDASRFITGHGVFGEATGKHALDVLRQAIAAHGKPASILTDRGSQFYANKAEFKKKGATAFETALVEMGIKHRLARVNHPQTNGKLERFHGEIQAKFHLFRDMDEFVDWYNNIRPHMSLDWDNLETPAQAFARKMPAAGADLQDPQNGERYRAETSPDGKTGLRVVE